VVGALGAPDVDLGDTAIHAPRQMAILGVAGVAAPFIEAIPPLRLWVEAGFGLQDGRHQWGVIPPNPFDLPLCWEFPQPFGFER